MKRFRLSPQAEQDLEEIGDYIARDSVDAAVKVLRDIDKAISRLADMPHIGHTRDDLPDQTLRVWLVHSYLIIYRPDARPMEVVRVLSGYRNLSGALN